MRPRLWTTSLLLAGLLGCSSGSMGPGDTVTVRLTDSPFGDGRAVLVTFSDVSAHRSGSGGFDSIPLLGGTSTRTCDLKKLVGANDVLSAGELPPGHYTQIRVTVTRATVYWEAASSGPACAATIAPPAGRSSPLEIPSGEARLDREFEVPAGATLTLTLDFDGDKSIHETGDGRFIMNPVIGVVSIQ